MTTSTAGLTLCAPVGRANISIVKGPLQLYWVKWPPPKVIKIGKLSDETQRSNSFSNLVGMLKVRMLLFAQLFNMTWNGTPIIAPLFLNVIVTSHTTSLASASWYGKAIANVPRISTRQVIITQIGFFIRPIVIVCFTPWIVLSFNFIIIKKLHFRQLTFFVKYDFQQIIPRHYVSYV